MKISIKAKSQDEFDEKREDLIKAIAGTKLIVAVRPAGESLPTDPRPAFYDAQKDILDAWGAEFDQTLQDIKADIAEVIGHE